MLTMMQILGYFESIVYIYIVCNRVFTELHYRIAHNARPLRCIFSRCTCFRRPPGRRENRRLVVGRKPISLVTVPTTGLSHFLNAWWHIWMGVGQGSYPDLPEDYTLFGSPNRHVHQLLKGGSTTFGDKPTDLLEILSHTIELQCTDERDMVCGVMFLAHDWQEDDLVVDYSMSVPEVFREAMVSFLQTYGSIAFLEYANFSCHEKETIKDKTPSWVPDWRKGNQSGGWHKSKARRKDKCPLLAHISGSFLHNTGAKLAEVGKYYGSMLSHDSTLNVTVKGFFDTFHTIVEAATYPKDFSDRFRRLIWLLIEGGWPSPRARDEEPFPHAYEAFLLISLISDITLIKLANNVLGERPVTLLYLWHSFQRVEYVERYRSNRCLVMLKILNRLTFLNELMPFISRTGSTGLAPKHTQPGDEVWLIPICERPIILRPQDGKHLVLERGQLNDGDPWGPYGGIREHLAEGEEIGGLQVEAICLQ
jgi:hypothetical protein